MQSGGRNYSRLFWGILLIISLNIFWLYYSNVNLGSTYVLCNQTQIFRKFLAPPSLTKLERRSLANSSSMDKYFLAEWLSTIVRNQIKAIQSPTSCTSPNMLCGHFQDCGFGCQVHHFATCLMISYALNLPLIHDESRSWPFSTKWSDLFEPLGIKCSPGNNTFVFNWRDVGPSTLDRGEQCPQIQIGYPLGEGIPVTKELGDLVEKVHPNPFLWWVGQFMKYTLRPNAKMKEKMNSKKMGMGFSHPVVCFHVRRTDKITEDPESHHELEEYMDLAQKRFQTDPIYSTVEKTVFIASDDTEVLSDAKKNYSTWNIMGFQATRTLKNFKDRIDGLEDIVQDILVLSECDYVVCGFSSNICRLLLETLSGDCLDSERMVTSLDGTYKYYLQGETTPKSNIIKVEALDASQRAELDQSLMYNLNR